MLINGNGWYFFQKFGVVRFQYFNFETDFLENENLFQKTGVPSFLVESTKIERTFLYKTTILEACFKANRMVSTK